MSQTICFIPFHPSHLRKNRLLLRQLAELGCRIDVVCVDEIYPSSCATRAQLESEGYNFERLDAAGFRSTRHWILHRFGSRHLRGNVRRLIREMAPALLLLCADNDLPARIFVRVAEELQIPSVLLVDGLALGRNPRYRLAPLPRLKVLLATLVHRMLRVGGLRGTSGVDRILVMNETSREEIIRHGVDHRRVAVVGSPEYDELARIERELDAIEVNRRTRDRLGLIEGRPVVLFAHQSLFLPRREEEAFIRELMNGVRACDGILIVKFHPRSGEDLEDWRAWAAREGFVPDQVVFLRDWSSSIEAVRMSAACVTVYSTVAVEALVLGTPLVLIQYLNTESVLPYAEKYGAAIAVRSPNELRDAIVRAVTDEGTRAALRQNAQTALVSELGGFDDRSLERSCGEILGLLGHPESGGPQLEAGRGKRPVGR
jgi:glycosyltransferase involved in cell wall biosynthesis